MLCQAFTVSGGAGVETYFRYLGHTNTHSRQESRITNCSHFLNSLYKFHANTISNMPLTALKNKFWATFTSTPVSTPVSTSHELDSSSWLSYSTSSVWTNISNPKSSTSTSVSPWTTAPTSSTSAWTTPSTIGSRQPNKEIENPSPSMAPETSVALTGASHNVVRRNVRGLGLDLTQRFEKRSLSYKAMIGWRR
jgi:hypothetical protein